MRLVHFPKELHDEKRRNPASESHREEVGRQAIEAVGCLLPRQVIREKGPVDGAGKHGTAGQALIYSRLAVLRSSAQQSQIVEIKHAGWNDRCLTGSAEDQTPVGTSRYL